MKYVKTIYSLIYPEVSSIVSRLWDSNPNYLYEDNFLGKQEGKEDGFFNTWLDWSRDIVKVDGNGFKYRYVTAGSSEAIRECIWKVKQNKERLVLFSGDYEGYKAFAESSGCEVIYYDRDKWKDIEWQDNDVLALSNPSSIDGCFWSEYDEFMVSLKETSVKVLIDLCYIGTTPRGKTINLDYENIHTIFISLSKVYGVYYHRIGGVLSKEPINGLFGNKWFKNMFSLELGIQLMNNLSPFYFWDKYEDVREIVVKECEEEFLIKTQPTDVFFLLTSLDVVPDYERNKISRICLTPTLYKRINSK